MNSGFHVIIREIPAERGGGFEAEVLEIPGLKVFAFSLEDVKEKIMKRIDSWLGLTRRLGWMVNINYDLQYQGNYIVAAKAV